MSTTPEARPTVARRLVGRGASFTLGLALGVVPTTIVWLIEPVPDAYRALALVPPSAVAFLVPAAIAAVAAFRMGGAGLLGVMAGAWIGLAIALEIGGPPAPVPHPWPELDGVQHTWFIWAGRTTLATTAAAGLLGWALARGRRVLPALRRAGGPDAVGSDARAGTGGIDR